MINKMKKWWKKINYVGDGDEWSIGSLSIMERGIIKISIILIPISGILVMITILLGNINN